MSKALIAGINQVATDKGLDREVIFSAIEAALVSAYKRNYGSVANVSSEVDRISGEMRVFAEREVVEDIFNPRTEITTEQARTLVPTAQLGDVIKVQSEPADFGRIAAQTAKQVILQRIREAERDTVFENFAHQVGEIITAQVRSIDALSGAATVLLDDKHEVLMMREDQISSEKLRRGEFIKVYVVDVHKSTRGPVIKISRTHRNLLKRLMEQEIPEVREGTVEIKSIAREPGARSKVAVIATKPDVDPVGSCVGQRGLRIQNIVNELAGEKIDVVQWNSDPVNYISNGLSPAKVNSVILDENSSIKTAIVIVPDRQLSLAIGKEGQNARLAAKLTGWRIDIKSESEAESEGLDRLAAERAHRVGGRSEDLLARAERLLQEERDGGSEDRLAAAARALDSMTSLPSESVSDLPDFPPLAPIEKTPGGASRWESAMAEVGRSEPEQLSFGEAALPSTWDQEHTPLVDETAAEEPPVSEEGLVEELPTEQQPAGETPVTPLVITGSDELPSVITADMLRARRAQRQALDNLQIPEELLAGYEPKLGEADLELELEEEALGPRGKPKGKGKAADRGKIPGQGKSKKATPAAKADKGKGKKTRRWQGGDDDLVDY